MTTTQPLTPVTQMIVLCTPFGLAGPRLERGVPLPIKEFIFPKTDEGQRKADEAQQHLQNYVNKYHVPKASKK